MWRESHKSKGQITVKAHITTCASSPIVNKDGVVENY